jgi:hypothetical protein
LIVSKIIHKKQAIIYRSSCADPIKLRFENQKDTKSKKQACSIRKSTNISRISYADPTKLRFENQKDTKSKKQAL